VRKTNNKVSYFSTSDKITSVCSQIHTKHINKLPNQNLELLNDKLVVHVERTWL